MRKNCLLLMLAFLLTTGSFAQSKITVKANVGEDLNALLATSRFLFPAFQDGEMFLTAGVAKTKMNYDMLSDAMFFVNSQKDTVALSDVEIENLQTVVFKDYTFKPSTRGFVEVLAYNPSGNTELVVKRTLSRVEERKGDGYGKAPASASTSSLSSFTQDGSSIGVVSSLDVSSQLSFRKTVTFYLTQKNRLRVADRSGFMRVYSKKKAAIEAYLEQSPVDFSKGEDLMRLYTFCEEN